MNKVFVTKFQAEWNFGPASKYGEVVFLTDKEHRPEPVVATYNERVTKEIMRGMADYIPTEDYIVMTAAAIPNMITAMLLQEMQGPHNVLRWNNQTKTYDLYKVNRL